jgi:hypothetical protein
MAIMASSLIAGTTKAPGNITTTVESHDDLSTSTLLALASVQGSSQSGAGHFGQTGNGTENAARELAFAEMAAAHKHDPLGGDPAFADIGAGA